MYEIVLNRRIFFYLHYLASSSSKKDKSEKSTDKSEKSSDKSEKSSDKLRKSSSSSLSLRKSSSKDKLGKDVYTQFLAQIDISNFPFFF